jgi:hypothetical protein
MPNPFEDFRLLDWLTAELRVPEDFPTQLSLLGSGPFAEGELIPLLQDFEIEIVPAQNGSGPVILGAHDWQPRELERVIAARKGKFLRFYSQEMFLSWILSGRDPFNDDDEELLRRFGKDHPAFNHLDDLGFDWPTTEANAGEAGLAANWPKVGLLAQMGYHVGRSARLTTSERRRILRAVFLAADLPNVVGPAYMAEWGQADSKQRLQKLANAIASLCRNERRRRVPPHIAIEQRVADLEWLREKFYAGRFDFAWPSTKLKGRATNAR